MTSPTRVTLELTTDEATLLAHLLKLAADEFGNHGCNDFNLMDELKLSKPDALKFANALKLSMMEHGICDAEYADERTSVYTIDWLLMSLFEQRLRLLLEPLNK